MRGAIHPLSQYAFMAWCLVKKSTGTTLPLPFTVVPFRINSEVMVFLGTTQKYFGPGQCREMQENVWGLDTAN